MVGIECSPVITRITRANISTSHSCNIHSWNCPFALADLYFDFKFSISVYLASLLFHPQAYSYYSFVNVTSISYIAIYKQNAQTFRMPNAQNELVLST